MKIKSTLTLTIALLLIFTACKKEEIEEKTEETEETVKRRPVYAGVSDSLMNSGEYNPVIQFNFAEIDSANNAKYASDSIDIDADGSIDFKFEARAQIVEQPPQNWWHRINDLSITPYNEYKIGYYAEFKETGTGFISADWASAFLYDKQIQLIKQWKGTKLFMRKASNGPLFSWGPWYDNTEDKYLGIRIIKNDEEKFGWIRIRKIAHDNIAIVGYAIEK